MDKLTETASQTQPYSTLSPEVVLDATDALGYFTDGRFLALNSYENRVFQVYIDPPQGENNRLVLKFYRPNRWTDAQILEEHTFAQELEDNEIPCVPPLVIQQKTLHYIQGFRYTAFECRGGRPPELEDPDCLQWIGRFLGRIHAVGRQGKFTYREALNPDTLGQAPVKWLLNSGMIPSGLLPAWQAIAQQALEMIEQRWGEIPFVSRRLHGDCHAGNILWTPKGPHFVDLDDSRSGPAVQDLWMLLGAESDLAQMQLKALLEGYERFCEFDRSELQLIEVLRTLRLLHYSAWLARRWDDPAFPAAFPWFGTDRYWQERILELREQVGAMQEYQPFDLLS